MQLIKIANILRCKINDYCIYFAEDSSGGDGDSAAVFGGSNVAGFSFAALAAQSTTTPFASSASSGK